MTVSNIVSAVLREGNGVTTQFPFMIEADAASTVKVAFVQGLTLTVVPPTAYTVVMNSAKDAGTVTFVVAPALATKIYIYRETPLTQAVSVSSQQAYNPTVTGAVWDKLTMLLQELNTKVSRAVLTSPGNDPAVLLASLSDTATASAASASQANNSAVAAAASALEAASYGGNQVLSFAAFSPAADGVTDDAPKFKAWLTQLYTDHIEGYIPPGIYAVSHFRNRAIPASVVIRAHPSAIIKGLATNDSFVLTSANAALAVSFPAEANGYGVGRTPSGGGTETKLTLGTHYTVAGQIVTMIGGTIGDTIRVWSQNPMIELGANGLVSHRIKWTGGQIDNSLRGYFPGDGSGSGLSVLNFDHFDVQEVHFQGRATYAEALLTKTTDTGFTATLCRSGVFSNNTGEGQADLLAYLTAGNDAAPTDDGSSFIVTGNYGSHCKGGVGIKRELAGVKVSDNTFEYSDNGILVSPTSENLDGGEVIIANNIFNRCTRPIWVQKSKAPVVTGNRITDHGYLEDGVTPGVNQIAIRFEGVTGGIISSNEVRYVNLVAPGTSEAVRLGEYTLTAGAVQTTNVLVSGNNFDGVSIGGRETNTGTGNGWLDNLIRGAVTPMNVPVGRKWQYLNGSLTVEGIGATLFEGTFLPTLDIIGEVNTVTIGTPTNQAARYTRQGDWVQVDAEVQSTVTHTEAANPSAELRMLGLPFAPEAGTLVAVGSLARANGIAVPANTTQLQAVIPPGASHIRIQGVGGTADGKIVGTDHIASGTSVRLAVSIRYKATPAAA